MMGYAESAPKSQIKMKSNPKPKEVYILLQLNSEECSCPTLYEAIHMDALTMTIVGKSSMVTVHSFHHFL
jgi:hypothetical protein